MFKLRQKGADIRASEGCRPLSVNFFSDKKKYSALKTFFLIKPFFCNVPCLSTGSNSREIFFKKGLRGNLQIYLQFDCVCGYVRGELLQACVAAIHGVASTQQQTH